MQATTFGRPGSSDAAIGRILDDIGCYRSFMPGVIGARERLEAQLARPRVPGCRPPFHARTRRWRQVMGAGVVALGVRLMGKQVIAPPAA